MASPSFVFQLPYFYRTHDLDEALGVPEFEKVVKPLIWKAADVADKAVRKARIGDSDLAGVLLAGGSSQIPLVCDLLRERFSCRVRVVGHDLMWLIAKGAAVHHRDLMTRPRQAMRMILGLDLYLEMLADGRLTPILLVPSHQSLPHTFERELPVNPHTPTLTIRLLTETGTQDSGQSSLAIRAVNVAGLNVDRIRVSVSIDANKTIQLTVTDSRTQQQLDRMRIEGDVLATSESLKSARTQYGLQYVAPRPSRGAQSLCVGIDLGTTTCEVIIWDQLRRCFSRGIPEPQLSQVLIRQNGHVSVDDGQYNPSMEGYFCNFKVDIGKEPAPSTYRAHGREWPPHVLSAHLLAKIWERIHGQIGPERTLSEAVITVPSDFSEDQCALVHNAARLAGIEVPSLLPEPIAAFLAYADTYPTIAAPEQLFLVFDFGGGTTDACVVRTNGEGPAEVVATYGDNGLGGNDLTRAVAGYVVDRFLASHELHVANDECDRLCRILGARASEAKVHLSDALSARSVPDA